MLEIIQLLGGRDFARGNDGAAKMANFVYLVADRTTGECVLVDPAWDVDGLLERVKAEGLKLVGVIATHGHFDHVGGRYASWDVEGIGEIVKRTRVLVWVNGDEAEKLKKSTGLDESSLRRVKDGEVLYIGTGRLSFIHTPGHTPGSQCLLVGDALLTGDTLFVHECGRVDLPGSSPDEMFASLRKLAALPDKTIVYPGHHYGPTERSTIGDEKRDSPALRAKTLAEWRAWLSAP